MALPPDVPPHLSVVIPAFNEEGRIVSTLEEVVGYLEAQPYDWEVVVVDDGSRDGTLGVARGWADGRRGVRVESMPHRGKGGAVRHGMLVAAGKYRFMCDADLSMPFRQVEDFLEKMDEGYDVVMASREVTGSRRFGEPILRHLIGRAFNWVVRSILVRGYNDTQCGFKCFRADSAQYLFGLQRTWGFGFDGEILFLARKRGMRLLEIPIDWHYRPASTVRPLVDSFLMFRDTVRVRLDHLRGRYQMLPAGRPAFEPAPIDGVVTVVIPTYNEAENVPEIVERIFALDIPESRIIIVDDNSPDGTAEVAERLGERYEGRIHLISRPAKMGLGTAYAEGFSKALADGASYVVQSDADLSHGPEEIPEMLRELERADVAVGSRYIPGGRIGDDWPLHRRLLSSMANRGMRMVVGVEVKDATTGFKAFRAEALGAIDLEGIRCRGFGFQVEVAHACQRLGFRVVEHPIEFNDRARGMSKMSLGIAFEALTRLALLRFRRQS